MVLLGSERLIENDAKVVLNYLSSILLWIHINFPIKDIHVSVYETIANIGITVINRKS